MFIIITFAKAIQNESIMELIIHNKVSDLDIVREAIEELGAELGMDDMDIMRMNLVMEEAVSNVILYAYPRSEEQEIRINSSLSEGPEAGQKTLSFVIIDTGMEFDPTRHGYADIDQSLEERRVGGLGIFLIKQYMNSVTYQRNDGRNILTMKKIINK